MPIKVLEHPLFKEGEKKGWKEGRKEGRKEGVERGIKKGLEKGLEKGIEKSKREDVINLYKDIGLSPDKIAKGVRLPISKVKDILKEEGLI